jgi:lysozyme family protein
MGANFYEAFSKTMMAERGGKNDIGYSDDKDDAGGETFWGISRVFNPSWEGWNLIDEAKKIPDFPKNLKFISTLPVMTESFYKREYWDKLQGDKILHQEVANELFDTAVNVSKHTAVCILQRSLSCLLKGTIKQDGVLGNSTLGVLNSLDIDKGVVLVLMMNCLYGTYLISCMEKNEVKEKYAKGWFLKRIQI